MSARKPDGDADYTRRTCNRTIDLTGKWFGRRVAVRDAPRRIDQKIVWTRRCDSAAR
jgi:hypothetical protein